MAQAPHDDAGGRHLLAGRRYDAEHRREAVVMALYVGLVLLAALVALPSNYDTNHGDLALLAIVWGTTVGLAITHWFAFVLAAAALGGGMPSAHERGLARAQLVGATIVALATTAPILLAKPDTSLAAASFAPAALIGVAGFGVVRARGGSKLAAMAGGVGAATLGIAVAAVKLLLSGH